MRFMIKLFWALFIVHTIIGVGFFYLVFIDGINPVTLGNTPFPMSKTAYYPGDSLYMTVNICKKKQYSLTIYSTIRDGFFIDLAPIELAGAKAGCSTINQYLGTVPKFLPPGKYNIQGKSVFHINKFSDREIPWETQSFIVTQ